MKQFAALFAALDRTTKTKEKIAALSSYFQTADDQDKLWTIALFSHRRPKRTVSTTLLRTWAAERSGIPTWLFEEAYHTVGDLAETISLLANDEYEPVEKSLTQWIDEIKALKDHEEEEKKEFILDAWSSLNKTEVFLFNKLITGGFRIGVSQRLMTKALAQVLQLPESHIAHRLMGNWTPDDTTFEELLLADGDNMDLSKPYPFYLAYALDQDVEDMGEPSDWQAEYKWDGIRSQLIKRQGEIFLWSRGEELVTHSYPEFDVLAETEIDQFAIDGELVVYSDDGLQSFNHLQKRLGRKTVSKKFKREYPCRILCYDLLEYDGEDIRHLPLAERRQKLSTLLADLQSDISDLPLLLSEEIAFSDWESLTTLKRNARAANAEGLMLKLRSGSYKDGRKKGEWWKWKVDPYTIDAVMLYAQRGHGRRSNLFTDFTFAVWQEDGSLVPFTKAYSGLTDAEFKEVTQYVNKNTIERFGPVRSVTPELVFEIAFEGINESSRHKSSVALRFPRIKRWRRDKEAKEADTLANLKNLLNN